MTTTQRTCASALAALLAASLSAQQPSEEPAPPGAPAATPDHKKRSDQDARTDIETLCRKVGAAHRPSGPTPAVTALRCVLELQLTDVREKNGGQVDLDVMYLQQPRPAPKRARSYIRYEVRGGEEPIRRGFDRVGPWHMKQGKPADLTAAGAEQDLASLREHINLASQLIRFLSPEQVIASLQDPGEVRDDRLRLGRRDAPVLSVSGRLSAFPMVQSSGEEAPAFVKIYIDKQSSELLGVDAWPLGEDGEPDRRRGERILLSDLRERDGLLVPRTLRYLFRDDSGKLRSRSTVKIVSLELRPPLTVRDFDRS